MNAIITNQLHIAAAKHIADGIAHDRIDEFDLEALHSDAGLMVGDVVVWHRTSDNTVVAWLGNDVDFDMVNIAEVLVAAELDEVAS